jgi:ADP-ribose pyrophosphatase YjhB (NUDIX family)
MIRIESGDRRFNYRVVGVAIHDDHVLLHRAEDDDFWALPGGRCELMEAAPAALAREMQEETGTAVHVERLLWVVESFFRYRGNDFHELGLYFLLTLPAGSPLLALDRPFIGYEPTCRLIFEWHRLASLDAVRLYPVFLRAGLHALPASPAHILDNDGLDV